VGETTIEKTNLRVGTAAREAGETTTEKTKLRVRTPAREVGETTIEKTKLRVGTPAREAGETDFVLIYQLKFRTTRNKVIVVTNKAMPLTCATQLRLFKAMPLGPKKKTKWMQG
jgi:hypothetical protein